MAASPRVVAILETQRFAMLLQDEDRNPSPALFPGKDHSVGGAFVLNEFSNGAFHGHSFATSLRVFGRVLHFPASW
jgi:hypothetical protein